MNEPDLQALSTNNAEQAACRISNLIATIALRIGEVSALAEDTRRESAGVEQLAASLSLESAALETQPRRYRAA